ncbi:alpha/beta fold hydrolase [Moritella yayanosii]|uniref:Putative epoxide hydrolase n=1 Tax=Moritella yayanosii TaxID=69539 RepID=A0A330LM63_9GAMM|nr:alpha/beta fold hydrolase [Moritella yayanosii]SQD77071.1 putative epoxide hydrolase [Moritella yayanosii]
MNKITKILLSLAAASACVLVGAVLYANVIGKGSLPAADPQGYTTIEANGLSFAVDIRGDKTGTPVILLHGFPESAVMWDKFMDELTTKGYYAIAPNQRGYSAGARPDDVEQYQLKYLASDVIAIADQLELKQFHLIGHDWGAAVGWQVAAENPDRVISYAAISVPHIDAFGKAYREDTAQYESSAYIRFFQKPILPEFMMAKNDYERLRSIWSQHDAAEIEHYVGILGQEKALTSAINWYRANFSVFTNGLDVGKVNVPVTFIWGNQDHALKRSGVDDTRNYVEGEYQFIEMDAGHWIIQEKYDELTGHLLAHLAKYK